MNILLVESSQLYREILEQSFRRFRGLSFVMAATQVEAMAAIERVDFDFVVVSGQLPDGDGLDLAGRLRQSGRVQVAPIVLLTGSASAELAARAEQAGVTELFRKQDLDELVSFARHFLNTHQVLRCRILYVEDATDQRMALKAQLLEWGAEVDAFDSADAAWPVFLAGDYDLVLTDVLLGGSMSGARLVNRIRRLELPRGGVPVLAITAFDSHARRVELYHLGIDDYVPKPIFPMELRARIHSLVARKRAAERSREVLAATDLGTAIVDEEGFILSMDDNARRIYGLDESTGLRNFGELLGGDLPDGRDGSAEVLRWLVAEPGVKRLRFDGVRANGQVFPVELSSLEIDPADGGRRFALLTRDISEQQALVDNLSRARESAERLGRMKAEFLANISHELRTPLNAILGMTYLLSNTDMSPEQSDRVNRIHDAGRHLLTLVDDVLDFSKIESGKLELEVIPLSVSEMLANVAAMIEQRASVKGLVVRIESESLPGLLCGDPVRLTQALLNYASNAVKFTERGTITLGASLVENDQFECLVRFEVTDTGIGIASEHQGELFESFRQADGSMTRRYGGAGLGLAITRELAALMGGEVGVSSQLGQGSTFWFSARLVREGAADGGRPSIDPKAIADTIAARHRGARVLFVDDDPVSRGAIMALLASAQLTVDVVEDGLAAVRAVRENDYCLVLMDIRLRHMDGLLATRMIRSLDGRTELPIVALTENAFVGERRRCFEAGMRDFVAKPVNPEVLFASILRWLTHCDAAAANCASRTGAA